ncbi:MAG: hypothetical protein HYZ14_10815 [Bacteroidetes bacterium]|nr:hypothetical protein [Bacteroidota bacterium]
MKQPIPKTDMDLLDKIRPADAPDFLLTRIMQRIENSVIEKASPRFLWTIGISFALIIAVNIIAVMNSRQPDTSIAESMKLYPDNNLYNE